MITLPPNKYKIINPQTQTVGKSTSRKRCKDSIPKPNTHDSVFHKSEKKIHIYNNNKNDLTTSKPNVQRIGNHLESMASDCTVFSTSSTAGSAEGN